MKCPFCGAQDTKVIDSRPADGTFQLHLVYPADTCQGTVQILHLLAVTSQSATLFVYLTQGFYQALQLFYVAVLNFHHIRIKWSQFWRSSHYRRDRRSNLRLNGFRTILGSHHFFSRHLSFQILLCSMGRQVSTFGSLVERTVESRKEEHENLGSHT